MSILDLVNDDDEKPIHPWIFGISIVLLIFGILIVTVIPAILEEIGWFFIGIASLTLIIQSLYFSKLYYNDYKYKKSIKKINNISL
jgi:hypothetical protein